MNIQKFIEQTVTNGGASYNPITGETPKAGFMVSTLDVWKGDKIRFEETLKNVVFRGLCEYIETRNQPSVYFIGSWLNSENGKIYVDVSENIQDLREAIVLGIEFEQLAVWDVKNSLEIKLPTLQKCGTFTQQSTYLKLAIEKVMEEHRVKIKTLKVG